MEKEDIVLVDIFDNKIGMSTKQEAHRTGKLHRAFSIFLYHDDRMLIQKRALCKYHSGGLWSNACCSHPTMDKIALSHFVQQRMYEELKIICPVEEVFQ
jgi:isopentenyl-diphosphate delta-isomerase